MLAGHGQLDLLVALAKRDPAPEVRAAAVALVARLAIDGKLPSTLVTESVASDATEIRLGVLGIVFDGAPTWLVDIAEKLHSFGHTINLRLRSQGDVHAVMVEDGTGWRLGWSDGRRGGRAVGF